MKDGKLVSNDGGCQMPAVWSIWTPCQKEKPAEACSRETSTPRTVFLYCTIPQLRPRYNFPDTRASHSLDMCGSDRRLLGCRTSTGDTRSHLSLLDRHGTHHDNRLLLVHRSHHHHRRLRIHRVRHKVSRDLHNRRHHHHVRLDRRVHLVSYRVGWFAWVQPSTESV